MVIRLLAFLLISLFAVSVQVQAQATDASEAECSDSVHHQSLNSLSKRANKILMVVGKFKELKEIAEEGLSRQEVKQFPKAAARFQMYKTVSTYRDRPIQVTVRELQEVYQKAAELGDVPLTVQSAFFLGVCSQKAADYSTAKRWFLQSFENSLSYLEHCNHYQLYAKNSLRFISYNYAYVGAFEEGVLWYKQAMLRFKNKLPLSVYRSLYDGLSYIYSQGLDPSQAVNYSKKALAISLKSEIHEDIFQDYRHLGLAYKYVDAAKSIENFQHSLQYISKLSPDVAWIYHNMSGSYENLGMLEQTVHYQYRALELHEIHADSVGLHFAYLSLGKKLIVWHNYKEAEKYLWRATSFFQARKLYTKLSESLFSLFQLYVQKRDVAQAEHLLLLQKTNLERLDFPLAQAKYRVAKSYLHLLHKDAPKLAVREAQLALDFFKPTQEVFFTSLCYKALGIARMKQQRYPEAIAYFNQTLQQLNRTKSLFMKEFALGYLAEAYDAVGDVEKAFETQKKLSTIKEQLLNRASELELYQQDAHYKYTSTRSKLLKLQGSNIQLQSANASMRDVLKPILMYTGLSLVLMILLWRRMRRNRRRYEDETSAIADKYERQSELMRKYTVMLQSQSNELSPTEQEEETAVYTKQFEELFEKLRALIAGVVRTDSQEEEVLHLINQLAPNWEEEVKSRYPQLTHNDVLLLGLLKLGFQNQEIADGLGISKSSLLTARYRIRKKLKIDKTQKLEDLL